MQRHSPFCRPVRQRGVTFVELMIAMVIVVILGKVSFDAYFSSIRKARRADAVDLMIQIQQAQERYRANNTTYASTLSALNISSSTTAKGYYTLALSSVSGTGYTATATAVSTLSQNSDTHGSTSCASLVSTVSNGVATNTPTVCWSK